VYTAYWLDTPRKVVHGGPSVNYTSYSAVAIEQEGYIDAINTPEWGVDQICGCALFCRCFVRLTSTSSFVTQTGPTETTYGARSTSFRLYNELLQKETVVVVVVVVVAERYITLVSYRVFECE
jgi:hypothetical protein